VSESLTSGDPNGGTTPWSRERVAAERRRIRLQVAIAVGIVGALVFSQFDHRYPVVRGASGAVYRVYAVGRGVNTRGEVWSIFKYLTNGPDTLTQNRELADLVPIVAQLAQSNRDSMIQVSSVERLFRLGPFSPVRRERIVMYVNRTGQWVRR
jgi:hypothetical protein